MPVKRGAAIRTKRYDRFRGVDFSTDPALVDDTRSPWAPNMVADAGGMPEKRPGWRTLERLEGRINGLFRAEFSGETHRLAHAGTKLVRWYGDGTEPETLAESLPDARSTAVWMGGSLWIFTGGGLYRYDGTRCARASEDAYAPLTVIARTPAGGGVSYEPVNLLSPRQRVGFLAEGGRTVIYRLPYEDVERVDEVIVDGEVWQETTETHGAHTYRVDLAAGVVQFNEVPPAPAAGAADNVFVTFTKTIEGYAERIDKCRTAVVWGYGAARDRIVAAGNPDYPNQDFICGFADGTYWPDTGYAVVGTDATAILGYRRLGEHLAIVKEDDGQDSTVFLRTSALDADGEADFFVKPCLAGAGAVTRFGFGSVGDEQVILTRRGVYALTTNSLTAERIAQNRSFRVDPRLTAEELSEAVCCSWNGAFLVFVGGRVYGLDGRQTRAYTGRADTGAVCECFYWENVPARSVLNCAEDGAETLYFGTDDGRVCRFSTDLPGMERYSDDGAAIEAVWTTPADDDGDPMVWKTLLRRGNAVTLKPYARSGVKILLRTERDAAAWQAAEGTTDIFDWEDIDFSRFTFSANDGPAEIPFDRRVRRYRRLQIAVKNDAVNEGFGVYAVVKHFTAGGLARR